MKIVWPFTCALACALSLPARAGDAALPLKLVVDTPLPGRPTRLDYQSIDSERHLLFIAHLGDSEVIAVDTGTRKVVGVVSGISEVHGVLVIPELNTLYATATGTNEVVAIDERTLRVTARAPAGIYPDGVAFDPVTRRLFISDEHGNTETVIDTRTNTRVATIQLGGEAGNTQYDPITGHIFVNIQTLGKLAEIDPKTNVVVSRTDIPGCESNHGLLIDGRRRAFVACEDNATLILLDMRAMHIVRTWKVGNDPDVLALDRGLERLYLAAESGTVSVFADGQSVALLAQALLAPGAHTVAVDQATHLVFFPLQNVGDAPVLRTMQPVIHISTGP